MSNETGRASYINYAVLTLIVITLIITAYSTTITITPEITIPEDLAKESDLAEIATKNDLTGTLKEDDLTNLVKKIDLDEISDELDEISDELDEIKEYIEEISPITPTPSPAPNTYLTHYEGEETKVLLLESNLRYGVYDQDIQQRRSCDRAVKKGDPCAIITVTIRNDYTEEWPAGYQIALTAYLYNTEGKRVGTVNTQGQLFCGFHEVWEVETGETRTVDIYVDYNKQDITRYELHIYNIEKYPTP